MSELAGRTIAGPVILIMENAFFQEFSLKHHFLRACYLGSDWFDWIVLIKSEILILTGMVWVVNSNDQSSRRNEIGFFQEFCWKTISFLHTIQDLTDLAG